MDTYYRDQAEAFASYLLTLPKARKRTGSRVAGRCPLPEHEDRSASFGYDVEKDAWACSCGGGKGSELMARLGWAYNVPRPAAPAAAVPAISAGPKVTEYPLAEADGAVVAWHIRRDYPDGRKAFSWRVPGKAQEGLHGLRKDELPLYGLPRLVGAPAGRPVILVEGERKADLLQKLAGDATAVLATATGAPAKPREPGRPWPVSAPIQARLEVLRGRTVWLWPDHDEPGREHMRQVSERLRAAGAGKVQWIEWTGAAREGDDAGDFVERGATAEDLARLMAPKPVDWRARFGAEPVKATELAPFIDMPVPYIIKPICVRGSLTQLQGIPKGGKSAFSVYLSLCAATGTWPYPQRLVGETGGPLKVIYIAWEDPKIMMAKRLSLYAKGLGFERTFLPENLTFLFGPNIFIEQEDHAEALRATIAELKPDIVFIDTLSHIHLCDENASSEMKIPMRNLDRIARDTEISIVYLHHTGKGSGDRTAQEKSRGSGAIAAAWHVLVDWGVREPGSNANPVEIQSKYEHDWIKWQVLYQRVLDEVGAEIGIRWEIEGAGAAEGGAAGAGPAAEKTSSKDRKRTRILDVLKGLHATGKEWVTASDVTDLSNLGLDERSIKRQLQGLCEEGFVASKIEALPSNRGAKNTLVFKFQPAGNLVDQEVIS